MFREAIERHTICGFAWKPSSVDAKKAVGVMLDLGEHGTVHAKQEVRAWGQDICLSAGWDHVVVDFLCS